MAFQDLLSALQKNAEKSSKPLPVTVPGIGIMYTRKRTIIEYERMQDLRKALANGEADKVGILGTSLARLLCDENGNRFGTEEEKELGKALASQPEEVMNAILNAADGETEQQGTEEGK